MLYSGAASEIHGERLNRNRERKHGVCNIFEFLPGRGAKWYCSPQFKPEKLLTG